MTAATFVPTKGHRDENFPVASILLAPRHRAPVMAFYRFARAADDIADDPEASAADKLARLAAMRAGLAGSGPAEAMALRATLAAHDLDPVHARDLLTAFEQDCTVARYPDWAALIGYCRISAMPVGRYVLDVHGEDRATWAASDALCAALQIINHLQDCGKDYRLLRRVYLPLDTLAAAGAAVDDLAAPRATPALRTAIAALATRTAALLAQADGFAAQLRDRRLAMEVAAIHRLATSLVTRLQTRDPLADRVHHRAPEALWLGMTAALAQMVRRR